MYANSYNKHLLWFIHLFIFCETEFQESFGNIAYSNEVAVSQTYDKINTDLINFKYGLIIFGKRETELNY